MVNDASTPSKYEKCAPPPPLDEWLIVDSIIQSWILTTISESLMERVLKSKPQTAKDIWDVLEKIFTDNKRSKTVELIVELRNLDIGDLTMDAYFRKIDSLASRLDNLGSNITEDELVTYAINGLNDKFEHVVHVILIKVPFPNLEDTRSTLSLVETRMNGKSSLSSSSRILSSSPTALVTQSGPTRSHGNVVVLCMQILLVVMRTQIMLPGLIVCHVVMQTLRLLEAHQKLLQQSNSAHHGMGPSLRLINNFKPMSIARRQETALPQAFSTLTLQDFENDGWNMDTDARLALSLTRIITSLDSEFSMTDLGPLHYFLGISVFRDATGMFFCEKKYAMEISERAADCPTTRRSTSGYCAFLGNNLLSWSSKRHATLSHSSAKAEYRGVANVVAETAWLRNLLRELHSSLARSTFVYCDNVSVVYMSSNHVQHQRTKHIEIDIHFVLDHVAAEHVRVLHVPSRYQFADIFTKSLSYVLFDDFRSSLSVGTSPAATAGDGVKKCDKWKAGTLSASSATGFDVESLAKLIVNDYEIVHKLYNAKKSQNMTELLQMKKMELELKAKELEIRQMDQRQKDEALYLSTTDEDLKAVVSVSWNIPF
ncbi:ribonuclease H-like domain-containing protein [Tanacetum coccineum]